MSGGLEPRASVAVGLLRSLESRLCWVLRKPSVEQAGAKGMSFSVFSQREGREIFEEGRLSIPPKIKQRYISHTQSCI